MTEERLVGWQPESGAPRATWHVRILGMLVTACRRESKYLSGVKYPPENGVLCALCLGTWQRRATETKLIHRLEAQLAAAKTLMASP